MEGMGGNSHGIPGIRGRGEAARSASSATTYDRQVLGKGLGTESEVR